MIIYEESSMDVYLMMKSNKKENWKIGGRWTFAPHYEKCNHKEKLCFWNLDNNLDNRLREQKEAVINKIYAHVPKQNIWKKGKAQNGFHGDNSFTYLHL
jgi:hypothetical protein